MTQDSHLFAKIPVPNPAFELDELDNTLLLFDAATDQIVDLNETAALVWRLCDGERSVGEMMALLEAAYPNSAETIRTELPAIIKRFATLSVIA